MWPKLATKNLFQWCRFDLQTNKDLKERVLNRHLYLNLCWHVSYLLYVKLITAFITMYVCSIVFILFSASSCWDGAPKIPALSKLVIFTGCIDVYHMPSRWSSILTYILYAWNWLHMQWTQTSQRTSQIKSGTTGLLQTAISGRFRG